MSNLPASIKLGAILLFAWAVRNPDGSLEANASVGNIVLSVKDVKDADGNDQDPNAFAFIEEVDGGVDKATLANDPNMVGWSGTFEGTGPVTWVNSAGETITKELTATGTCKLSDDPSAGDVLVMEVTIQDAA